MRGVNGFFDYLIKIWIDLWISFPIVLAIGLIVHEGISIGLFLAILVLSYMLGFFARYFTRQRKRYIAINICTLSSLMTGYALGMTSASSMIVFAIYNFLASFRGVIVGEHEKINRSDSAVYYLITMVVYFFAYFVYRFTPALMDYLPLITYMGLVATVSTLLIVNRDVLIRASRSSIDNYRSLTTVKRNNRIITIIVFLLILAIASYSLLKAGIAQGVKGIIAGIVFLIRRILSIGPTVSDTEEPPVGQTPYIPPAEEGSDIWRYITTILVVLVLLVLLILFIRLLVKLAIRYIPWLISKIKNFLRGEGDSSSSGYSDEKESLFDWQLLLENSLKNIKGLFSSNKSRMLKWKDMKNNKQRIRYIYSFIVQGAIDGGLDIKPGKTPKETSEYLASKDILDKDFAVQLAKLYGKARYSIDQINDKETELIIEQSGIGKSLK